MNKVEQIICFFFFIREKAGAATAAAPIDDSFDHSSSLAAAVMSTGSQATVAGSTSLATLATHGQSLARLPTGLMTSSPSGILEGGMDSIASLQVSRRSSSVNLAHDDPALLFRVCFPFLLSFLKKGAKTDYFFLLCQTVESGELGAIITHH